MTEFVNQTINDLSDIIKLLQVAEADDIEIMSEIEHHLLEIHRSLHTELNRKVMQDATKQAAIKAYIRSLGYLYKNAILTVL